MSKESTGRTVKVAACVCLACSILVSTMAVVLKPRQDENKTLDRKRNVLIAAGLAEPDQSLSRGEVEDLYESVEGIVIDVESGAIVPDKKPDDIDWEKIVDDPKYGVELPSQTDIAKLKRSSAIRPVYLLRQDGELQRVIFPVRGKGLWSTMKGFLALEPDLTTIACLTFYEHGETPGLGGKIDNAKWKAQWVGKLAFDERNSPVIDVLKGNVSPQSPYAIHEVDGLSGATLTGNGVENLVRFWLGKDGYGPYLKTLRSELAAAAE